MTKAEKQRVADVSALQKKYKASAVMAKKAGVAAAFGDRYLAPRVRRWNCLHCGHSWKRGVHTPKGCPKCRAKFTQIAMQHTTRGKEAAYTSMVDVYEGYQVVRLILLEAHYAIGHRRLITTNEVMQFWIAEDGSNYTFSKATNNFGWQYDQWIASRLSFLKARTHRQELREQLCPHAVHIKALLPRLQTLGYSGQPELLDHCAAPQVAIKGLLSDWLLEVLLKQGQYALFKTALGRRRRELEEIMGTLKIALRHRINLPTAEHVDAWLDYIRQCKRLGLDTRNPAIICPSDAIGAHDKMTERINEAERRKKKKKMLSEMAAQTLEYQKRLGHLLNLSFKVGEFEVSVLKTVEQFYEEAHRLNHCVWSSEYYKKENSLILSARLNGEPVETIEVDLRRKRVEQSRGMDNEPTVHHEYIVNGVNRNIKKQIKKVAQQCAA